MNKALIVTLCSCFLLVGSNLSIQAQTEKPRTPHSNAAGSSNSDQEELKGPVRRVRVEIAQILVKNDNLVEGLRELRGIATYDQKGLKVDSVTYPREDSMRRGREQYRYDDKGNIVELVLLGDDGSILSKVIYKYELDELGNWKKMTSAIAVYENGTLKYEPIEVAYRTITYYYGQAVDKLASAASNAHASDPSIPTVSVSTPPQVLTIAPSDGTTTADAKRSTKDENGSRSIDSKVTNAGAKDSSAVAPPKQEDQRVVESGLGIKTEAVTPTAPANNAISSTEKPTLRHVSEKILRDAAVNLPTPEYPEDAWRERADGKVEVQIIVDEKGAVGSARVISGNSPLNDAAERAARNARFSPAKLSSDSAKVFGVIRYDFVVPASTTPSVPASTTPLVPAATTPLVPAATTPLVPAAMTPVEVSSPVENENAESDENPSTLVSPAPSPDLSVAAKTANSLEAAAPSLYEKGLRHLREGRHAEAVEALKQNVQLNSNDAIAYVKLGMAHSALRQYKEAIVVLKMAIRIKREVVDALGYYHLGQAYAALDKPSNALEAFKQALYITREEAIDPPKDQITRVISFEDLHYNLGMAYHELARYHNAIKELREVVKLNPKMAEAYYGLGVAYLAMHDTRSAQEQEAPLRSLNPALANKLKDVIATMPSFTPICRTLMCP
jgi:TonB family protein